MKTRSGITNFYTKIAQRDSVKIAYFGGSITNANGWRDKTFNWFKEKYPNVQFEQLNAAIGGTGSNLGAFRLEQDVLTHKPDLIIMEFAVNDSKAQEYDILRQYEGIVRKLWKELPETDICFVYTIKDLMGEIYNKRELPYTISAAEKVADYYGIPSLNFGVEIMNRVNSNQLVFRGENKEDNKVPSFSKDGVHPYKNTGHQIYFEEFKEFQAQLAKKGNDKIKKHHLKKPLFKDNWESAQILPESAFKFKGDWTTSKQGLFETSSNEATLSFEFFGTMLGIYDWIGPAGTELFIFIDGKKYTKMRFDKHCNYNRANYFFIDGLKDGSHSVEIKLGRKISVQEKVMILKERLPDADNYADRLTENTFRLKQLLVF